MYDGMQWGKMGIYHLVIKHGNGKSHIQFVDFPSQKLPFASVISQRATFDCRRVMGIQLAIELTRLAIVQYNIMGINHWFSTRLFTLANIPYVEHLGQNELWMDKILHELVNSLSQYYSSIYRVSQLPGVASICQLVQDLIPMKPCKATDFSTTVILSIHSSPLKGAFTNILCIHINVGIWGWLEYVGIPPRKLMMFWMVYWVNPTLYPVIMNH